MLEAARKVKVADHMLTMTYPLVKDPKLLIAVLENIHQSMDAAIRETLLRARQGGKIPLYSDTLEGRYMAFQKHFLHRLPKHLQHAIRDVRETVREHKQAPVEFRRNDKFVICDAGYKTRTLTENTLKQHIKAAKELCTTLQ